MNDQPISEDYRHLCHSCLKNDRDKDEIYCRECLEGHD